MQIQSAPGTLICRGRLSSARNLMKFVMSEDEQSLLRMRLVDSLNYDESGQRCSWLRRRGDRKFKISELCPLAFPTVMEIKIRTWHPDYVK